MKKRRRSIGRKCAGVCITARRSGKPVRILFSVLPPDLWEPEEDAETVILLLRLLHGAQMLQAEDTEEAWIRLTPQPMSVPNSAPHRT